MMEHELIKNINNRIGISTSGGDCANGHCIMYYDKKAYSYFGNIIKDLDICKLSYEEIKALSNIRPRYYSKKEDLINVILIEIIHSG